MELRRVKDYIKHRRNEIDWGKEEGGVLDRRVQDDIKHRRNEID